MIDTSSPALRYESEPQVKIEEAFDAPRERVFDAWIRAELLERWFAPHGCSLRIEHLDARTGGSFHWCIHDPEFGECWTIGSYIEVVRPERIVLTSVIADASGQPATPGSQGHDPEWPAETLVRVTFDERGGQTLVTLEQSVSEVLAKRTGAHPSWLQMFERLRQHLAGRSE